MSKRLVAILAAVLAIAAIAGCGSSDNDTGTAAGESTSASEDAGGPALSKAEFVKQGNEVCTQGKEEAEAKLADAAAEFGDEEPSEEEQARVVTDVIVPSFEEISDGLAELKPPAGEEDGLAELIEAFEDGTASVVDDPIAALEGDPFGEANEKAEVLGLDVCAEN
ncbi:MAG TPA: hypothetical protein VMS60_01740 [Solirubrobacterales bacterium]|nr:hypothetical protein [Solirubrobacterales bacterium]